MFQSSTRLQSLFWPFLAAVVLLLIASVVGGGIGVSGAVILTFSMWLSILGLVAVGAFLAAGR